MPKSSSFGHTGVADQDVAGLEIAVHHKMPVRIFHGGAHVQKELQPIGNAEQNVYCSTR